MLPPGAEAQREKRDDERAGRGSAAGDNAAEWLRAVAHESVGTEAPARRLQHDLAYERELMHMVMPIDIGGRAPHGALESIYLRRELLLHCGNVDLTRKGLQDK
jgi:hypothetical protein